MKLAVALAVLPAAAAFVGPAAAPAETRLRETKADLEALAKELNPTVGFYDPLGLSSQNFWGKSEEETIGFLRHAEIKHGRVAMAAFSGYVVQANGFHWPWAMTMDGRSFDVAGSPPEQWDAIPLNAKLQIVAFVVASSFLCVRGGAFSVRQQFGPRVARSKRTGGDEAPGRR